MERHQVADVFSIRTDLDVLIVGIIEEYAARDELGFRVRSVGA
jgi:hypothetical protein